MSVVTLCERLIESGKKDDFVRRQVLSRLVVDEASAAVDREGKVLDQYLAIAKGKGSGPILRWIKDMEQLSLFHDVPLDSPITSDRLELYMMVASRTKGNCLLCHDDNDYVGLHTQYPRVGILSRVDLRNGADYNSCKRVSTVKHMTTSILFVASEPSDTGRLRLGEEHREIENRLKMAKLRDQFQMYEVFATRPEDLTQAMLDYAPDIVHFSGHGGSDGRLILEDRNGEAMPVSVQAIESLFSAFSTSIKGVILNSCYSSEQATAIAKHIDFVVGIESSIADDAAIAYAMGLYQGLGAGKTFSDAHKLGCVQVGLQGHDTSILPDVVSGGSENLK